MKELSLKVKNVVGKASDWIYQEETAFIVVFTLLVGVLIIVEIIVRTIGLQGIRWLEELSRIMLICTTMIGCSMAVRHQGHMIMDTLYTVIDKKVGLALKAFVNLLCAFFWIWMGYHAAVFMLKLKAINKMLDSVSVPIYLVWVVFSVAIIMMGIRYIVQFANCVERLVKKQHDVAQEDKGVEQG